MRRVVGFFALAYAITWAGWATLVAPALGWTTARGWPYLHLVASLGPALAAVIATSFEGRAALRSLLARCVFAPPKWIAIATGAPVVLFLVAAGALRLLGHEVDLRNTGESLEFPELGVGTYVLLNVVCYGFGEELGWRGFALPHLLRTMSTTRASLIIAVGWAIWHLPLFSFSGMSAMGPGEVVGWFASIVAGSFLMTALFSVSGGSVLAVALFHGALDILIGSPTGGPLQTAMGATVTIVGFTVPFWSARVQKMRVLKPALAVRAGSVAPSRDDAC